ncbi:MAG TPA: GDP-mannose 4,6-dehydratase [Chitinophagaceae bacterium]|nr:GDP-mannose 4,6-dehydratase [Chitinophagaceae bacterium]
MKAIIWGASGQDGYFLTDLLKDKGIEVIPVTRQEKKHVDITNFEHVRVFINKIQPDYIFNFAANSTTRHDVWKENHETICTGTLNILEAVKNHSINTKVFLSGSGLQFQNVGRPIHELSPFEATSMYAVSRIHMTYAARYYRTLGVKAYTGFFFNHDSPRRSERHINKRIIEAARRIAAGSTEKLEIGDVSVRKEFGFAGDIVKGVWILVQQESVFEAVIGTGVAYSIEEWLEICFAKHGLNWRNHVVIIPDYKAEYKLLVSDPATIHSLGWKPEVSIRELANLMSVPSGHID